jgi:hypothetical protein
LKRKLNSFILFFWTILSFAQIDVKFIDHLASNNLAREHKAYLNSLSQLSDSTCYFKAKFNLKYPNDTLFMSYYLKSKVLSQADTLMLKEASAFFLKQNKTITTTWFNSLTENENTKHLSLNTVYKASLNPNMYSKDIFPAELQKSYSKYKRAYNKKPVMAAVLSTLLPGSGKFYAGKTKTFFLTFLLNAAYAAQTVESAEKLGISHPVSIVNACAFTVFYLSNIYGSYKAVTDIRKERKKQFIIDASNFYN